MFENKSLNELMEIRKIISLEIRNRKDKEYRKKHYQEESEKRRQYYKKYRENHREYYKTYSREYYRKQKAINNNLERRRI